MSATIIRRDQAIADLKAIVDLIREDRPKTATRLVKAAEKSIQLLGEMPELGSLCHFGSSHLADMRMWPIDKFKNFLTFYRPIDNGIEVIRVVHGSRDLEALFS